MLDFHVSRLVYVYTVSRRKAFANRPTLGCSPGKSVRLALEMSAGHIHVDRIAWSEDVSKWSLGRH